MNFYVVTDTHFGHDKMPRYCGRPHGYEEVILSKIEKVVKPKDVLIHLGDVCWGNDEHWHLELFNRCPGLTWLVRGNHDKKSSSWYLRFWHFVGDTISMDMYGKKILFSHMPQKDSGYDINIHGHFHNSDHCRHEPELVAIKNDKQKLVMMEHEYRPFSLKELCCPGYGWDGPMF